MRAFFRGVLIGTACMCALALVWLCLVRPGLTAHEAESLKAAYSMPGPEANRFGALPLPSEENVPTSTLDFISMQKQYPDVRAWLTIPGTEIDYPVLQSSLADPEYYLRRNYKGEWRMAGSLFLQADCTLGGRTLVIYGHNMSDDTMFGGLPLFLDAEYARQHDRILLQTSDGLQEYHLAAVLETDVQKLPFNRTSFSNDEDFLSFTAELINQAAVTTSIPITAESRLLLLVTCSYSWENARYVLVAIK